jgi:hypothetical protein
MQREIEMALALFYEVNDCVVFVSGHGTKVTVIGPLCGLSTWCARLTLA